jgi:hypothetical protein
MHMLEARFHPRTRAQSDFVSVGYLVWRDARREERPVFEPARAAIPEAVRLKLEYLVDMTEPGSFERLQALRSEFWSFAPLRADERPTRNPARSGAARVGSTIGAIALVAAAAVGCGHGALTPASSARVVPNAPTAAYSVADGVRCSANVGAWNGREDELPRFLVPVKVRIKNDSGQPIRVLYEDFALVGSKGRSYHPVPVLPIDADARKQIPKLAPIYASSKFFVAPGFRDVYATLEPWTAPLQRDDALYDRLFRRWGKQPPPLDVLRVALPEGVLDEGGVVTGYLFFESPLDKEDRVTFAAIFDGGDGRATVASIEIPFKIE